jgi:hypothetical protein
MTWLKNRKLGLAVALLLIGFASLYAYSRRKVSRVFDMKWTVEDTLGGKGVHLVFVDNPYWYIHAESDELADYLTKENKRVIPVTLFTRGDKIGNITDVAGFPGPFVIGIGNGCGEKNMGPCNADNTFDSGSRPWRR